MAKKSPATSAAAVAPTSPAATAVPLATVPAAQPASARVPFAVDSGTIAVAAGAVLLVAVLAYPGHSSTRAADEFDAAQPALVAASADVAPPVWSAPSKKTAAPRVDKSRLAESTKSAAVTPVGDTAMKDNAATKSPAPEAIAPVAHAAVSTVAGAAPVTITGCLETSVDQDAFRLTDTDGVDAPRSRSWRSGFVKKTTAAVALVDAPSRLALATHVGRRVTATGLLTNHDLRVSALRFIGPPCN